MPLGFGTFAAPASHETVRVPSPGLGGIFVATFKEDDACFHSLLPEQGGSRTKTDRVLLIIHAEMPQNEREDPNKRNRGGAEANRNFRRNDRGEHLSMCAERLS